VIFVKTFGQKLQPSEKQKIQKPPPPPSNACGVALKVVRNLYRCKQTA